MRPAALALCLILLTEGASSAGASGSRLPDDFLPLARERFAYTEHITGGAGGAGSREESMDIRRYPVIMIPANARDRSDWTTAPSQDIPGVYERLRSAGFSPAELWLYEFTRPGRQMRNIEELTDGLRAFIYSVLWYTGAPKVQLLAHGEGAVLARATVKKYNLYNLVHAEVHIAGPFHGSSIYSYVDALRGNPVHANLAPGSDFLNELLTPDETPYNVKEGEDDGNFSARYMTIRSSTDPVFCNAPDSPALSGAANIVLNGLDHDALRTSPAAAAAFIPFLSDGASPYAPGDDRDGDGFVSVAAGGADCDDTDPTVYPGAREIRDDGVDQDCNRLDRSDRGGRDVEVPLERGGGDR